MKRTLAACRWLAVASIVFAIFAPTTSAAGALIYRPTGISVDEIRSPNGQSQFVVLEVGAKLDGERFINPLCESSIYPQVYDAWESVAARLFGEWKFVAKRGDAEEIYTFTISPFAYSDIGEPFPVISPPHGTKVSSPFIVTVENGSLSGAGDGSLPGGWELTDVRDVKSKWLGDAGYQIEFGQAGQNARMLLSSRSSSTYYPFVSPVTPPPNPSYLVSTHLSISRGTTVELFPFRVPEPSGLSLLLVGAAFTSRRLRRPQFRKRDRR